MMAAPTLLTLASINVASIKSDAARFTAFDFFGRVEADILFLQETRLPSLAAVVKAKRDWRRGPSFWSLAAEPYSGVAVLFTAPVECRRVIELEMGRCLILDVLVRGQELRLINIYGPQSKWDRKCLFTRIKPFLFTSRQVIFGGDFNTVTRSRDRGGPGDTLAYDSIALNSIVSDARLVDAHIRSNPGHAGYTYYRGSCRSRIDRFFLKEETVSSAVSVVEVEFSDHCMIFVSLNVSETPRMGKGYWRLNSSLLEEPEIRQSFETFLQDQVTVLDFCSSKSEWWEMFKKRAAKFFRQLSSLRSMTRYRLYQGLRRKLEHLVSNGDSREEISRVKALLKKCQYERHSSLVFERDFGKFHSPDPYKNCKMSVSAKIITGLVDSTGSLSKSRSGILEVVRAFYSDFLGRKDLDRDVMSAFLADAIPESGVGVPLDVLTEEITEEEVKVAIDGLSRKKSPGPDGLTSEFYKTFKDPLAPLLTEIFNECLSSGTLPKSMRRSALILLSKGKDPSRVENFRPIALLNTDRKVLAKILFNRLVKFAPRLLSEFQHCSIPGRSAISAVLNVREAVERGRAGLWEGYMLSLDQAKAFDRVDHEYLWSVLSRYGLPGGFVNWLKTLYAEAESFPFVNGWSGPSFEVGSGVRQGCPLSPLLYVFAIDPLLRRIGCGPSAGVGMDLEAPDVALKVVAYADDVTLFVSSSGEADSVMSEVDRYSVASGSMINLEKCESLWLGGDDQSFGLPGALPEPSDRAKVLGISFGLGDYPEENWDGRLKIASLKVNQWKGWSLSLRERVCLIKTFLLPLFIYLGSVCVLPEPYWVRIYSLFFQMLWGNRLNLIKREVTYRTRELGGLAMVNPVVFLVNTFLKVNLGSPWIQGAPPWVHSCREWFRPFFQEWEIGGRVKDLRVPHGHLPAYATLILKVIRQWGLGVWEIRSLSRKLLDVRVLQTHFWKPLALKDCPGTDLRAGLSLLNSVRIPHKYWDLAWRCFHGRLYVRDNLKYRNSDDRDCPREECAGLLESMDHFLLHCPFNAEVYHRVGVSIGWPGLASLSYPEWAYGAFKFPGGRDRVTLFLVSLVVRFFTWNARCLVSTQRKVLPVDEVIRDTIGELVKVSSLERDRLGADRASLLWRGFVFKVP